MINAAEALLAAGQRDFGLLFVVGEERNSAGAYQAAQTPRGSRYIINGEPTENQLALGSQGRAALRSRAPRGKMAHSAYPELGDSAIDKLLDALAEIRRIPLPVDHLLGPSTLNIGTLSGGRAPNVIADEARAEILIRLVGDSAETKAALARAAAGRAELREVIEIPAVRLNAVDGIATTVVAFTTDIPAFGGAWGEPFLIGPGTIHVAHTLEERVPKAPVDRSSGNLSKNGKGNYANANRSRHSRRHRHGGPAFHQVPAGPPVVRPDVAGRERPLGRQEVYRTP